MNTTSRPLGASPVSVGPLGLGCWPLAGMTREGVSREVAVATVRAAIDAGVTHLDTAYCYGEHGESEQAVCEAVGGGRDAVVIASKCGIHWEPDPAGSPPRRQVTDGRPERLRAEVEARIALGEQSLLFLNRRGYAPITLCRACGHQVGCDHCDARMVEHRFLKRLVCHQCGATKPIPLTCPHCSKAGHMAPVGPGVERLGEEVAALFPAARVAVLSSDLFGSARALKAQIAAIAGGEADIIIGTQLVAKGHNFPLLTLVGVIDADLGLQGSDLRAAERTFQLMRQVAGRAGRVEKRGLALLQTYQPDHAVIRAILAGDEEGFWRAEAAERRAMGVPPYGRMAGIILSSPSVQEVFDFGAELARRDGPLRDIGAQVYGPAPAPIARIRGRHRVRLLVKAEKTAPLQAALARWVGQLKQPANLRLAIDIDPQSFY